MGSAFLAVLHSQLLSFISKLEQTRVEIWELPLGVPFPIQKPTRQVADNWALWFLKTRAPGIFKSWNINLENQVLRFLYLDM